MGRSKHIFRIDLIQGLQITKVFKRVCIFLAALFFMAPSVHAQKVYSIELPSTYKKIIRGHLALGGIDPNGDSIAVNSYYIEVKGKPFIPVIGEFHYSRYPSEYWEESILKMKAGGINVIATYVFWNLHERKEGTFDWSGNLDLKKFITLCQKHAMQVIVRLGPFGHGEIRNGALPDWLYGRPFEVRSNDEGYLHYVKILYGQIGNQLQGLFYKDGGNIIGVQLENEFQHTAAPWEITYPGSAREYTVARRDIGVTHEGVSISQAKNENATYGNDHMATLKKIANAAGIDVPIYTATGWGNAAILQKGSVPVTAGYAYPTWAPKEPSPFYLYKDIHHNPDYAPVSYDPELYPSVPAELGSGIMITNYRRPTVIWQSIEPMIVRTLGSGSNGIGYYMYHGGSTPVFDHFYSEESTGLPKISYDFQAPIGEFGDIREHYRSLKLLHMFLDSYGDKLAPLQSSLPVANPEKADDVTTLRYAVRSGPNTGFVFMHNFQDHIDVKDIADVQLKIKTATEPIVIPAKGAFTLKAGASAILPFNLDLNGLLLKSATVQPLTKLERNGAVHYVFFSNDGFKPMLVFDGIKKVKGENCVISASGNTTLVQGTEGKVFSFSMDGKQFLVIPRSLARQALKVNDVLLFSEATLLPQGGSIELLSAGHDQVTLSIYPGISKVITITGAELVKAAPLSKLFSSYTIKFKTVTPTVRFEKLSDQKYVLKAGVSLKGLNDLTLRLTYKGDRAMAFFDGLLVADHFYYGKPWDIGLKRFIPKLQQQDMVFIFHPLSKAAPYLIDFDPSEIPDFSKENSVLQMEKIDVIPEYKAVLSID
ncbi:Glycosyl hydrolases family 35 [Chryseolinea serpens]|uniref:Glycosyl hydrolases family 35 n=2 Tax=Chryseolinea serpens TaxID=947013 RepID=A0A1M5RCN7_9BACT|nr:Glycosyl hydrolases family 35 [Chryseolinea serpens]